MTIWHAILLGFVQGLGEFLPISSSAHLVLIPWIFNWPDPGLTFDSALHVGTLIALIAYFWRDWFKLILDEQSLIWVKTHPSLAQNQVKLRAI